MCFTSSSSWSSCKSQQKSKPNMKAIKRRVLQRQRASDQNEHNSGKLQSDSRMSHQPLGRLPPLQAIGRVQSVDLEDPPDFDEDDVDQFLNTYEQGGERPQIYYFELEHARSTADALEQTFKIYNPGNHASKRSSENAPGFTHCKHGSVLGKKYGQLCDLIATRARLQLIRDYTSRINAASMFVKDLESVTREECQTWYGISHNCLTGPPETKLECLSAICEDLRVHMNHWNSIKQLIHTDKWLRTLLPSLCTEMDIVRQKLAHLRNIAMWWIDRLIHVGFRVLAHCDPERLGHDALWSVTRGLEDFNNIVMEVKVENQHEMMNPLRQAMLFHSDSLPTTYCSSLSLACFNPVQSNSMKNLGESLKPIPFARVLNLLASERAKYAAASTQEFFTTSEEYLNILLRDKQSTFAWVENPERGKAKTGTETSDYHSATGSRASVSTALLKVGNSVAPDLSKLQSPLSEFARREQNFANKFLQIVCNSTSLLRKPNTSGFGQRTNPARKSQSNNASRVSKSSSTIRNQDEESTLSKSDPKRKSVSWGDAAEVTIISQLTQRYVDLLWQYFGNHMFEFLQNPIWGGICNTRDHLGNAVLVPDLGVMLLVRMIHQTCLKDIFPSGAVISLTSVAKRLQVNAAWSAWDEAYCAALASRVTDKCQATPLAESDYATKTAKLLRDAFQPLQSVLASLDLQEIENYKGQNNNKDNTLSLLVPTLERLSVTCDCSTKWCHTKSNQFLSAWSLGSFLLITLSDLKILGDETKLALSSCQNVCMTDAASGPLVEVQMHAQLSFMWQHLNSLNAHMQSLSGAVIKKFLEHCFAQSKDYFEDEMPNDKRWKKKSSQDLPSEHNSYVEHAMDSLIEPIVSGVDKLKSTSHISAISIGVKAMCDAWTEHILKKHIRFSLYGAYLLELDFMYARNWLSDHIRNSEVKQSILCLDAFKNLMGIVCLLKRQPRGRTPSRPRDRSNKEDRIYQREDGSEEIISSRESSDYSLHQRCDVSVSNTSADNWSNVGDRGRNSGGDKSGRQLNGMTNIMASGFTEEELANYKVPKMEQWLALRVQGGARSWPKLPSCFTNASS